MKMLAGHHHAFGIHSDDIMKLGVPSAPAAHGCCALPLGARQPAAGMGHEGMRCFIGYSPTPQRFPRFFEVF